MNLQVRRLAAPNRKITTQRGHEVLGVDGAILESRVAALWEDVMNRISAVSERGLVLLLVEFRRRLAGIPCTEVLSLEVGFDVLEEVILVVRRRRHVAAAEHL